ncbi:RNA-binding protein 28-like [Schistocerca gregaria]|uniref:RNA-binding protein 28-like n=1 Tax=Schistocerca gregaria TaxID=7010 RepID=UPI00211F2F12|nr:RNA-binding protein 28-like [Schistocerca gregaria]
MVSDVAANDDCKGVTELRNKVFVKNLSSTTTDEDLIKFFEALAPLKKCYVIKGQDGLCRGYGYAQFVFEEDAKNVIEKLNKAVLNNQVVDIEYYKRKEKNIGFSSRDKSEKNRSADAKSEPEKCRNLDFKDELEEDRNLDSKDVPEKYRSADSKDVRLSKVPKTKVDRGRAAASKKTNSKLLRKAISYKLRDKKTSKSVLIPSRESDQMRINVKRLSVANRTVAISNLPKHLTFDQISQVKKIDGFQALEFPLEDDPHAAYVLFSSVNKAALGLIEIRNAADSLFNCSKLEIDARLYSMARIKQYTVIVRNLPYECTKELLVKTFEVFGKIFEASVPLNPSTERNRGFGFVTFSDAFSVDRAIAGSAQLQILDRKVEVSRTVKHRKLKEEQADQSKSTEGSSEDDDDYESTEEEGDTSDEFDDGDNEKKFVDVGAAFDKDKQAEHKHLPSRDSGTIRRKEHSGKGFLGDASLGKTLFLRNIALDTTEEEIRQRFSEWGPIVYVKFVKDRETGDFVGTGFVQFVHAKDAQKCIDDAYLGYKLIEESLAIRKKLQMRGVNTQKESDVVVNGRHLVIDMAVTRENTCKFKAEPKVSDSRNLSLAKYSVLSSEEVKELTKAERLKYEHSQHEKKQKLSNPNFHVSKTRLCVRNLPKSFDEKKLKLVFRNAATLPTLPPPRFHQVKIVRNKLEGNKSRGYGFVEFMNHAHAKAALLALHNKTCAEANGNRLFVEFAIENMRVLFSRKLQLARQKEFKKPADSNGDSSNTPETEVLAKGRGRPLSKKRKRGETQKTNYNKDDFDDASTKRAKRVKQNSSSIKPSKTVLSKDHISSNRGSKSVEAKKKLTKQAMRLLAKRRFLNQVRKRNKKVL